MFRSVQRHNLTSLDDELGVASTSVRSQAFSPSNSNHTTFAQTIHRLLSGRCPRRPYTSDLRHRYQKRWEPVKPGPAWQGLGHTPRVAKGSRTGASVALVTAPGIANRTRVLAAAKRGLPELVRHHRGAIAGMDAAMRPKPEAQSLFGIRRLARGWTSGV